MFTLVRNILFMQEPAVNYSPVHKTCPLNTGRGRFSSRSSSGNDGVEFLLVENPVFILQFQLSARFTRFSGIRFTDVHSKLPALPLGFHSTHDRVCISGAAVLDLKKWSGLSIKMVNFTFIT